MSPSVRRSALLALTPLCALLAACSSGADHGTGPSPVTDADTDVVVDATGGDATGHDGGGSTDAGGSGHEAAGMDAGGDVLDEAVGDAGSDVDGGCEVFHVTGECILVTSCMALGNHTSYSGYCPGPADIECCVDTHNEPTPAGWALMQDAQVTPPMTTWAVMILNDPTMYPMYSTTTMFFGSLDVLARVEWHPPDINNSVVHRGVTLYVPAG